MREQPESRARGARGGARSTPGREPHAEERGGERERAGARGRERPHNGERAERESEAWRGGERGTGSRGGGAPGSSGSSWLGSELDHPMQLVRRFADEMDRAFSSWGFPRGIVPGRMWPPIEAYEEEGRFVIRAELPGMSREDVHVRMAGDTLIIEGERRSESRGDRPGMRSEWTYGRFARRIPLPHGVDPDQIQARFQNGVLEVTIEGLEQAGVREVPIQGGEGGGSRG